MAAGRRRRRPKSARLAGIFFAMLCVGGCAGIPDVRRADTQSDADATPRIFDLFDPARNRRIPVALYGDRRAARPLAIISHGYGGRNTDYAFLANALVARGYVVASLQQDLPGDPVPASRGDLAVLRKPIWQKGVDNILFAVRELEARGVARRGSAFVLTGHSNGGDTAMLFATLHPRRVSAAFSLDNRRMPMPRTARPRICSVRSADQSADPGVLPSADERRAFLIAITDVPGLRHDDMWDGASAMHKERMIAALDACLGRRRTIPSPSNAAGR